MTEQEIAALALRHGLSGDYAGFARVLLAASNTAEPHLHHPKVQMLLSKIARQRIELGLIERMIDEPDFEYFGSDYDYQTNLTDKVESFVKAAREGKPLPAVVAPADA